LLPNRQAKRRSAAGRVLLQQVTKSIAQYLTPIAPETASAHDRENFQSGPHQ
jgi:hypothetical protein